MTNKKRIADFRPGIDEVVTENGKSYVVATDGLYKRTEINIPEQPQTPFTVLDESKPREVSKVEQNRAIAQKYLDHGLELPPHIKKMFPDLVKTED